MAFASSSNAPNTGLEGGEKYSYGPGSEYKQNNGIPTQNTMIDAYGNPVLPESIEEAPRDRLRRGAYGGGSKGHSAPLPDLPETDAGWHFE